MRGDINTIQDALNLELISKVEIQHLTIDEQDTLITIRDYKQDIYSVV